jgi:hypothetical protein
MTSSQQPAAFIPAVAATVASGRSDDPDTSDRELVGESDAAADAAGSGADVDLDRAERDSDGVPVGRDDLRADVERSGGDPDAA